MKLVDYLPLSVEITGPGSYRGYRTTSWTANVGGGTGDYTFYWDYTVNGMNLPSGISGPTFSYAFGQEPDINLHVIVTDGFAYGEATFYAYCWNCIGAFSTFPNPASEVINVQSTMEKSFDVQILDRMGTSVKRLYNMKGHTQIQTSDLPDGQYTVRISSDGESTAQKVIIKK